MVKPLKKKKISINISKYNCRGSEQVTPRGATLACRLFQSENNQGPECSGRNFGLPPYDPKEFKVKDLLQEETYHLK